MGGQSQFSQPRPDCIAGVHPGGLPACCYVKHSDSVHPSDSCLSKHPPPVREQEETFHSVLPHHCMATDPIEQELGNMFSSVQFTVNER